MSLDPEKFQGQVMNWAISNFPTTAKHQPLLGIVEEVGELIEACVAKDVKEIKDACGDIMIFMAHYCGVNGYSLLDCVVAEAETFSVMTWTPLDALTSVPVMVGKLCHAHLKMEQQIRTGEKHSDTAKKAIGQIAGCLRIILSQYEVDLMDVMEKIWGEVSQRNWKKNPKTGKVELGVQLNKVPAWDPKAALTKKVVKWDDLDVPF